MTNTPRSVLVTGADGRIGRAAVARLRADGWRVVALAPRFRSLTEADAVLRTGDATDEADVAAALDGVDAVVHLAAVPHWEHGTPYEVYTTNVVSTFNVLVQAAERGIRRAVIASSIQASGVPGNHHDVLPAYYPIDESLPPVHDEWYSLSKYSDELTARMVASRWGMSIIALRFPWVDEADALREVGEEWTKDPAQGVKLGWSYLDVRDAATAVVRSLEAPVEGSLVVQLAAPRTLVPFDTEELLDAHAPGVPRERFFPGRAVPVSTDRAERLLGFVPEHELLPTSTAGTAG
ncbi:NAD(P)-dependent oxidoreductase [Microbacterium sp.]|uniref:NAD-dependent epimerase/dehydratase family protein n=1 Tax=Microbacterium sp. TaxID=51671 RepID=UPI0033401F6D